MRSPIFWWQAAKTFVITYPAVLSGYIIYSYLFLCIIRFFLLVKAGEASTMRTYETFVAVPFLWLLALSLVKVIEVRTRLHDSETRRLQDQQELEISKLQLTTLREVVRGVQHQVNNPLGVILFAVERIKRSESGNSVVFPLAEEIEVSIRRVTAALTGFTTLQSYQVASAGCGVGNLAIPGSMPELVATQPAGGRGVGWTQ